MLEKDIEKRLKVEVEKKGGLCIKWTAPNTGGLPDRIVIWPDGRVVFVELKAPGKSNNLSKLQIVMHKKLRDRKCKVLVISTFEEIDKFIQEMTEDGI